MKILSINIGQPETVQWKGKSIRTSIFKSPVKGPKRVSSLNIEGDGQADLRFHGGVNKAIYSYDSSYYTAWKTTLPTVDWSAGMFGENLTTEGLPDHQVQIGNVYQAGTLIFQAIQPRIPCFKLNLRFQRDDLLSLFYEKKCYGIYFKVIQEGIIEAGDNIQLLETSTYHCSISDIVQSFVSKGEDQLLLNKILNIPLLPKGIRQNLSKYKQ
ncbi:MOSC domain-containing protein [Aureispira anguillae]|uniref:MOSC domain-containing protein n=1 Tax=Aureispira anguillae TaxID=2864201 RepID=A0A915YDM7_9BACT|nr:MOSC domain-containing protein [Aureispira anguillae]BDS11101.1 MOSC domain-containing protein [Aureispira anguillae]